MTLFLFNFLRELVILGIQRVTHTVYPTSSGTADCLCFTVNGRVSHSFCLSTPNIKFLFFFTWSKSLVHPEGSNFLAVYSGCLFIVEGSDFLAVHFDGRDFMAVYPLLWGVTPWLFVHFDGRDFLAVYPLLRGETSWLAVHL